MKKKIETFIPGIWTQSTAVPVAFERNSVKVSSAIDRNLQGSQKKMNQRKHHKKNQQKAHFINFKITQQDY